MRTIVLFVLLSLALMPSGHKAISPARCVIESKSVKPALKQSAAVFSGEVLELKDGGNYDEVRLRVEHSWKGVTTEEVSLLADRLAESPNYRVGHKYLVFAGLLNDKLFTGNCSRTKKLEQAQADVQELGEPEDKKH